MTTYKARIGRLILVPSDGGRFEISVGDDLVFSKLEQKRFPEWDEVKELIDQRLTA